MSYITKKGADAMDSTAGETKDFSKALASFKVGSTYKVRIPSTNDVVEYMAASVFGVFKTTPVTDGNRYEKASKALYAAAKDEQDEAKAEELRKLAGQLRPKPRYLLGFINLEDGEPIVIDVSRNQKETLKTSIKKYAKRIDKLAFELAKEGTKGNATSTAVSLTPVLDMDEDLTEAERKNFEDTKDKEIPDELYENVLYVKDESEQLEDLRKFAQKTGVSEELLGIDGADKVQPIDDGALEISEDDLPF